MSTSDKYKPGEFGYWWTITEGREDIEGVKYDGDINSSHYDLVSLKGAPCGVTGSFYCHDNKLTSLEHCPETVGGCFSCSHNELTNLKHCPREVGGNFRCSGNQLTSLRHLPGIIAGGIWINDNILTTLKHSPEEVRGDFVCSRNQLPSFAHAPKKVLGDFKSYGNNINNDIDEIIINEVTAESYTNDKVVITFEELEVEKRNRAIKRQLGPFAITAVDKKL